MSTININLKHTKYTIHIEKGLLNSIGENVARIYKGKKIVLVTDKNVEKFYLEKVLKSLRDKKFEAEYISIKPGEQSKTLDTLQEVYKKFCEYELKRGDLIISLGGGVVGDLTGFAAATYLRGIKYIQIPTSLLAQVDSSIGGKVAVDLPYGKNLVGSFYHPQAVFIDTEVLNTLDEKFFNDGMAEVIKYGLIRDKTIVDAIFNYSNKEEVLDNIEEIIYKCCSIKKSVVENDEKDIGERMILNFGHTLGHCVEKYFNYEAYTHGEAVAIGMAHITKRSENMGITEKGTFNYIKQVLQKYKLPLEMPNIDYNELCKIIRLDKKAEEGSINLIMLTKVGESKIINTNIDDIEKYII
ncbi:3-dehydroquinate synthase [Clostridium thailandense]|uniref:3-dehydroquinate synthase n=1 Tax=Clostridium thailandense TaxID=2794346 RepID=UPI003989F45C